MSKKSYNVGDLKPTPHEQRAALEEKRGEPAAAARLYTRALTIDRHDAHVYRALARLHISQLAFAAARGLTP